MSQFIEMFAGKYSTVPLKEMLSVTFPGEWGSDDESGDGVKVIRTTNFTNEGKLDLSNLVTRAIEQKKVDKKKLVKGDIILERSGGTNENPVGRVVRFDEDGTYLFNNFTQLLRPSEGVNSIFLFYSLFSYYQMNKTKIRSMGAKTTGIQNLKMDSYLAIPVCNAPIGVQEQFAAIYEQADKSEFDGLKSQFIEMFKDAPKIPLTNIFDLQVGKTPARANHAYWDNGEYKWMSIADLGNCDMIISSTKEKISQEALSTGIKVIPSNTIVMSFKLTIGTTRITGEDMYSNEAVVAFLPKNKKLYHQRFMFAQISYKDWEEGVKTAVKGKTLNQKSLSEQTLLLPSEELQMEFEKIAELADKSEYYN